MSGNSEKMAKAKEYALNFISYRLRSTWEVRKRLSEKGYENDIILQVIGFLKEYRFIDDREFALMWIRSRTTEKPSGRRKISYELTQKGVPGDIIKECLADFSMELEEELAYSLAVKRTSKNNVNLKKLQSFLLRRGFDYGVIKKVISRILNEFENQSDG